MNFFIYFQPSTLDSHYLLFDILDFNENKNPAFIKKQISPFFCRRNNGYYPTTLSQASAISSAPGMAG
jgi:hypothetical protein